MQYNSLGLIEGFGPNDVMVVAVVICFINLVQSLFFWVLVFDLSNSYI